jgi:hypothetical protein
MSLEDVPLFVLQVSFAFCINSVVCWMCRYWRRLLRLNQKRCKAYARLHGVTSLQLVPVPSWPSWCHHRWGDKFECWHLLCLCSVYSSSRFSYRMIFMFWWPCISKYACNEANLMNYLLHFIESLHLWIQARPPLTKTYNTYQLSDMNI